MIVNEWTIGFGLLYLVHHGFEYILDVLQSRHLGRKRDRVPKHLQGKVDLETIKKAARYNLAKLRLGMVSRLLGVIALVFMMGFGFAFVETLVSGFDSSPILTGLLFFGVLSGAGLVWDLPLELVSTFGIEQKYGFNKQTPRSFALDKIKEVLVSAVLGAGLLTCVLLLMDAGGSFWWLYAFVAVLLLQLLIAWIYPVAIMPLFNKFTPVEGDLAGDVATMATRVRFNLKKVVSMDGSKRSTHSNAFFIGLFGAKRVVLFDTLLEKLGNRELLAVLAHEFGHFKLRHLTKRLVMMSFGMLALFAGLAYLRGFANVYTGFGFTEHSSHAALIIFGLLISEVLAPVGFVSKILSRRDERAADRFAVDTVGNGEDLKEALIALTKQNLASPGSHKWYRTYHNSHPTLKSRLRAITEYEKKQAKKTT